MEPKKILFANVPADGHFNPMNVERLRDEFRNYDANKLSADLILNVIK